MDQTPFQTPFQPPVAPHAPFNPLKKSEWLKSAAPKSVKLNKTLALVLSACCLLLALLGTVVAMNTSIEDVPLISIALDAAGGKSEFKEMKEDFADSVDRVEEFIEDHEDEIEDELDSDEMKALDHYIETMKDIAKSISIHNFSRVLKASIELSKTGFDEIAGAEDTLEEVDDDITQIIELFNGMYVIAVCASILSVIGGLLGWNWLLLIGLISSSIYSGLICGMLILVLNIVLHVAIMMLHGKVKKAYKAYAAGEAV